MHWTDQTQRRRAAIITVSILVLVVVSISYSFIAIHDLSERQDTQYDQLQASIANLSTTLDRRTTAIEQRYEQRLDRMSEFLLESHEQYEQRTENLRAMIEQTERENDIQLNNLKEELNNLNSDSTKVVNNVIGATVSISNNVSQGSGSVITDDGYIVTNYHVVGDTTKASIMTNDDRVGDANVVATNEARDLAILKTSLSFDTHIPLADSSQAVVGEPVIAIGSPEGLDFTVTQGIISASKRTFDQQEGAFIQTDVPINSGSSGGPLVNMDGEMVGVNTFKIKGSESLGFAIPSNDVATLLNQARNNSSD